MSLESFSDSTHRIFFFTAPVEENAQLFEEDCELVYEVLHKEWAFVLVFRWQ